MKNKLDRVLSVIILLAYAVLVALSWVLVYQNLPAWVMDMMAIMRTVVLCLMFLVVLYNACGWTENWILRIVFVVLTVFLIASAIAIRVPAVSEFFYAHKIPIVI